MALLYSAHEQMQLHVRWISKKIPKNERITLFKKQVAEFKFDATSLYFTLRQFVALHSSPSIKFAYKIVRLITIVLGVLLI